jgi:anti-sigma factor RsiW
MSCVHFEDRWDDFLAGNLSDVERRAAAAHLDTCARCSALVATLRDALATLPEAGVAAPPADLAPAVLARTSGGACAAARDQLCDLVDGMLLATDSDLVESHLSHCSRCAALRTTLVWLRTTLPAMATLDPGPAFTRAVLAATMAPAPAPERAAWRQALAAHWRHLVARPRFAWEAAYVGLLLMVALFGTSVSPFRDVPPRALAVVQLDPLHAGAQVREVHRGIGGLGRRAWSATGAPVGRHIAAQADAYADRHPGMHEAYGNLQVHLGELRQRWGDRNIPAATMSLHAVRGDLRALWKTGTGSTP